MADDLFLPLEVLDPANHYQWLGLPACEEDPERIRRAIREKQRQLASADSGGEQAQAERRRLKKVASILLTPARKVEYDSTFELELRSDDWDDLPSLRDLEPGGTLPPFPATVGTFPPPVPKPAPKKLNDDQIRWIGIGAVLLVLFCLVVVPILFSQSSGESTDVAQGEADAAPASTTEEGSTPPAPEPNTPPSDESTVPEDPSNESSSATEPAEAPSGDPEVPIPMDSGDPLSPTESNGSPPFPTIPTGATGASIQSVNFLAELDLPPPQTAANPTVQTVEIGQINEVAFQNFSLKLDSGACNLDGHYRFELAPVPPTRTDRLAWHVTVVTDELSAKALGVPADHRPTTDPVGRFYLDSALKLHFQWNPASTYAALAQLRNARLLISAGGTAHVVALRRPVRHHGHVVSLLESVGQDSFTIPALPADENIYLELTQLSGVIQPIAFEPTTQRVKLSELQTATIGAPDDTVKAQLRVAVKRQGEEELSISVVPRYLHNGRWDELTDESVTNTLARVQRAIFDGRREAEQSVKMIAALEQQLRGLRSRRPANLEEAAAINRAIGHASAELKSQISTLRRRSNQIPASYSALASLYRVVALGRTLNNIAHMRYRIFAMGSTGEVNLVVADSTPPTAAAPGGFQLPNKFSSPVGNWILDAKPPLRYEFMAGGTFYVRDLYATKTTASGRWTQSGDQITLEAKGRQIVYEIRDGVEMRSENGVGLFRQIDN